MRLAGRAPSVLFDRATAWMLAHKVLLPSASLLERFVAKLRSRVEARLWRILGKAITPEDRSHLEDLLRIPEGGRNSWLDRLRRGPVRVSAPALVRAIARLNGSVATMKSKAAGCDNRMN